ncbi:MAG: hypothetical protein WCS86_01735 [Candidatus Paceibacterota bacterium]
MMTSHFFKTLLIFAGMIILGLIGVYLVNSFDESENSQNAGVPIEVVK